MPYDDAAVERATKALYEHDYPRGDWDAYAIRQPKIAERMRESMRVALRAASEPDAPAVTVKRSKLERLDALLGEAMNATGTSTLTYKKAAEAAAEIRSMIGGQE